MEYSDEKFVDSIIKSLQSISDNISGDKEWTQAIKMKLIEVSEQFGFHSNCSLAQALNNLTCKYQLYDPAEWMYDMIVYTVIDPQKLNYSAKEIGCIIDNIILCAESEWRPDIYSILYDFQKLLFSRTKIRLMVYQANNNNKVRYSEIMKDIIKNSKSCRDDDIFVFAVYDSTEDNGTLDITRFTVNDLKISKTTK